MQRSNVKVEVNALVTRVILESGRAVGVEYVQNGVRHSVRAEREVLLAGGVINSPQLLMLSGIGDPEELQPHGIAVMHALPGVGRNLQDHVMAPIAYRRRSPGPFQRNMRLDRVAAGLAKAYFLGTGFATDLPGPLMAFLKTSPELAVPDMQLLFHGGPLAAGPYLPPFKPAFADGFSCIAVVLRPESRGRLRLASSDPAMPIRIHQNFLSAERDWQTLRAGIRLIREVNAKPPLERYVQAELAPGAGKLADADLDAHIRATSITVHHPLGTCRMGPSADPMTVVDPELRVHGIDGLRVVDASVMPSLVGGNINAPVMMIAERAADLIAGRPTLAPDHV